MSRKYRLTLECLDDDAVEDVSWEMGSLHVESNIPVKYDDWNQIFVQPPFITTTIVFQTPNPGYGKPPKPE